MTKIVYNTCYGGFGLSEKAILRYAELKGIKLYPEKSKYSSLTGPIYWTVSPKERKGKVLSEKAFPKASLKERQKSNAYCAKHILSDYKIKRSDPILVQVVEELGEEANGRFASLAIAEVAPGTRYRIDEYDGNESICTIDDYEWNIA